MIFDKLLYPSNSLIFARDYIEDADYEAWLSELDEVGKYYRWKKLSELVTPEGIQTGGAAIVFTNPRKKTFLRAIPELAARDIPVTLFLRPDCIGLNRLPPEEELLLYGFSDTRRAWEDPEGTERFLLGLRKEKGPLPLERVDPTLYFATWGKILDIPPKLRDLGFHLYASPNHDALVEDALRFTERQVSQKLVLAYASYALSPREIDLLRGKNLYALLTSREGILEKTTDKWDLPSYNMKN
jgi:hypothetical protein